MLPNLLSGIKTPTFLEREASPLEEHRLSRDAATAISILKRLTSVAASSQLDKAPSLPGRLPLLKTSQAVAVIVQTKAGLGLGLQLGTGFIINRLGPQRWSAPCYFTMKNASAGLTVGYRKLESIMCIRDEAALRKLIDTEFALGTDVMLSLHPATREVPGQAGPQEIKCWEGNEEAALAAFTLADGLGLDISLKGGLTSVDAATNRAVFGEGATPDKLLQGEVPPPPQFGQLYALLHELESEAA